MNTDTTISKPNTILVVAESKMISRLLSRNIKKYCDFETVVVESCAHATDLLNRGQHNFFAGLVSLDMAEVIEDGLVDAMVSAGIPTILLTEPLDDDQRDQVMAKGIVDYVLKDDPAYCLEQIVLVINQLRRNEGIKAMVVDDSRVARMKVRRLLEVNRFQIFEAVDGVQALQLLEAHPDIRLVLSDYNMPEMDGVELVKRIRRQHPRRDMAIIGLSTHGNNILSSRFLKAGASDFLTKPFLDEELYFRINQNLEVLDQIRNLTQIANQDPLTGLLSRRHFYEMGQRVFERLKHSMLPLTVAMADIDHFKRVNDVYGHHAGDMVLARIGEVLQSSFRGTDLIGRFGGEEFCFLLPDVGAPAAAAIFEELRQKVNELELVLSDDSRIRVTMSVGVVSRNDLTDLDSAIRIADGVLYLAEVDGRDRVRFDW